MSVLEVQHVKKFFGKRLVLDDINFSIDAGASVSLDPITRCNVATAAGLSPRTKILGAVT